MTKNIDVLILCGGKGKRLKKITGSIPKPMVCLRNRPFLDFLIGYLRGLGLKRIILGIGYQADYIRKYYQENPPPGIRLSFCEEKRPLGTGGAIRHARRLIKSREFLVLNGDTFAKFKLDDFISFFREKKAAALILLKKASKAVDYGAIKMEKDGKISSYCEKTRSGESLVNAGVYLFNKSIFRLMPREDRFSLETDFFPCLIGKGMYGYQAKGFFMDIGTPDRYRAALRYLAHGKI